MGKLLSKVQASTARIVMVGLDGAGKTTIVYKLKLDYAAVDTVPPTIGFNVETVNVGAGVSFTVWDVGGQDKVRPLWSLYFRGSNGVLFVVDSSDRKRLPNVREELHRLCKHPDLKGVPIIVVANKQDVPGAMRTCDLVEKLGMNEIKDRFWQIQGACALRGTGLLPAMTSLAAAVKDGKKKKRRSM